MKLGTGDGFIKPYQAGEDLAATIGALPVPLSGPPLPSPSASVAPLGGGDPYELTAAYARGLEVGSALQAASPVAAGEAAPAPDLQRILDALPGLTKPGLGRPAAIFALTGIVAGMVIRSVAERHGDEALKRVADAVDDLVGLPSALLTPDGRIIASVAAGATLTCDLLAFAMTPSGKAGAEDPSTELTGQIVLRADEFRQAIEFATQIISPAP